MKITFDAVPICSDKITGIGWCEVGQTQAFAMMYPDISEQRSSCILSSLTRLMLNSQQFERVVMGAPYINDDCTYTLRPDNPRRIAVYETVDSQFILNDLSARLRYQYGIEG